MIIWGSRGMEKTAGNGQFHCPRCGGDSPFEHVDVRRYFTLYFIPLIPLGSAGEYIRCNACAGTYAMEILSYDPEVEQAKIAEAIRRICIMFLVDVKRQQPNELMQLCDVVGDIVDRDIEPNDVAVDVQHAETAQTDLLKFAKQTAAEFSEEGKFLIIVALRKILESTSGIMVTERNRLLELGKAMGLRKKHVEEILNTPLQDQQAIE